ncbi:unnamed protein product [Closterium sp. NIES-54]
MYALSVSVEGDCYQCVPPDPGIAAAALGASESGTLSGTAPDEALHTFTLDSGASRCFFRDRTTITPLVAPVTVRLADPSGGLFAARSSTVLPCPADAMVTNTTPGGQRVLICTCTRTGRHLATFTRRPGSSLYTLATEPPKVAASAQVSASGQVVPPFLCRLLSHHRLGHPSLPRLRGMHSRLLISGLPRSLPPLPPLPAPPCLPCVKGRQRAAPHSSSFPPKTTPLQTLHMDVWGPACVSGLGHERYFLLVVDDYTRYTMVFPLRSKGQVVDVLIPWIHAVHLQLRERFRAELPVLRLQSDRGGEFSSDLLRNFCRGEGILQSFTLPDSPKQNGIAERCIGLVMELNLCPHVSLPETLPIQRWTGKVGDASVFRVWGSRAFVRDTSTDKLSARAIPCVFLGFVPDAPGWQFYHPTSRRVLPSQVVTFDESVPCYRLFPYCSAPLPPPPLFLAPGPPLVDLVPPQGPAPSGVSLVDPPPGAVPGEEAVDSGAARGTASGVAEPGGVETGGAEPGGAEIEGAEIGGAEPEGVEPGGAESEGAESGGAEPQGAASSGGSAGASSRLSSQQLREWLVRRARLRSGATGAGGAGVTTGAGVPGAGDPTESGAAGAGGCGAGGAGTGGAEVGGTRARGAGAGGAGAVDPGGTVRLRLYFVPLLQQTGSLTERREPTSRLASPVHPGRRVPRPRPPSVPGTHAMTLCPSSVPLRVPLPAPPKSSLPTIPDPESDRVHAASPNVSCLLATAVTDPSFESTAASALFAELLEFAAACRLDYAIALVAESDSASPPPLGAAMDAEMASWKSTGTYVDEVPPPGANIVDGMWIFRVKRPPGSPPAFKASYVAQGFRQRQGVEYFQTFSPTPKMTTLWVFLHVAAQRDNELHSLDFSTAFLQGSLHEEIWLRRPPGFTRSFPACTQWSLRRPVYDLRQAPRKWHDTLRTTLAALGFAPSTTYPSLFLRNDTSLPPFYVLVYVDNLIFATADTEALTLVKSELQKRHTCTELG